MKTKWMIRLLPALAIALPLNADDGAAGLWDKHCAKCHAKDGSASSPIGKKLEIKDYTNPDSLAEVTDEELFTMTKEGVKGTKMPGFAKKLSDEEIHALVAYMRAMAKS